MGGEKTFFHRFLVKSRKEEKMKIAHLILRTEVELVDSEEENFDIMGTPSGTFTSEILAETRSQGKEGDFLDQASSLIPQSAIFGMIAEAIESAVLQGIDREKLGIKIRRDQARVFSKIGALVIDIQSAERLFARLVNLRG